MCLISGFHSVLVGSKEHLSAELEQHKMENRLELDKVAYIAGDEVQGTVTVKSKEPINLRSVVVRLIGKGVVQYFHAKTRAQKLCELVIPIKAVQEHCLEGRKQWRIPVNIPLKEDLPSTIDSGRTGKVTYFLSWDLVCEAKTISEYRELTILAKHALDQLPRREEMKGTNQQDEDYDLMKLSLYSPAKAYLPGEMIQFRVSVRNFGKKPVKKLAILVLQNVLFFKSEMKFKGRTRSFLMSVNEKQTQIKQDESYDWTDEIMLPDPIPPSADLFHKIDYELVLVAITKGNKSSIRKIFDQARYHFDLEKYQDDYFRDFLPHACCLFEVGSHHGETRPASLTGGSIVTPINELWKHKSKQQSQRKQLPKSETNPKLVRITFKV